MTFHMFFPNENETDRKQIQRAIKLRKEFDANSDELLKLKDQGITRHKYQNGFYYTDKNGTTIPRPK